MPKFKVSVCRTQFATLLVEADTEDDADSRAINDLESGHCEDAFADSVNEHEVISTELYEEDEDA